MTSPVHYRQCPVPADASWGPPSLAASTQLTVHIPELHVTRIRVGLLMMGGKKVSSPNQQKRASIIVTEDE